MAIPLKLVYTPVDATVTAIRNYQVPSTKHEPVAAGGTPSGPPSQTTIGNSPPPVKDHLQRRCFFCHPHPHWQLSVDCLFLRSPSRVKYLFISSVLFFFLVL